MFLETFYRKRKNYFLFLIFYISHKNGIKFFYKGSLMNALRTPFNQVFKNQFSFSFFFGSGPTIWQLKGTLFMVVGGSDGLKAFGTFKKAGTSGFVEKR